MLRHYPEYENDRFFEPGVMEDLFPRGAALEKLKKAVEGCVHVDRRAWTTVMRRWSEGRHFKTPAEALAYTRDWLDAMKWDTSAMTQLGFALGADAEGLMIPALEVHLEPENALHESSILRIPLLVTRSRHDEELLTVTGDRLTDEAVAFRHVEGIPDRVLDVLLDERRPFVLQAFPGGVSWWRRRGGAFASFTVFFHRILENAKARERAEVVLPAVYSKAFVAPSKKSPLKAADVVAGSSYNSYPIRELRSRFKGAMETLASAALEALDEQEKERRRRGSKSLSRQPEPFTERLGRPLAEQLRIECSRYLYRLLFLFSAEAKRQIVIEPRWAASADQQPLYSTQFLRRKAASLAAVDHLAWIRTSTFLWDTVTELFELCRHGCRGDRIQGFAIPPFNGQLFEARKIPLLSTLCLPDRVMASVIDEISRVPVKRGGVQVWEYCDYATLQVNHLGEIYQWLLEFEPKILAGDSVDVRAKKKDEPFYLSPKEAKALRIPAEKMTPVPAEQHRPFRMNPRSSVRSQTGTHFTNASLGTVIAEEGLRDLLVPLVETGKVEDILSLSVVEPCIGSAGIAAQVVQLLGEAVAAAELNASEKTGRGDVLAGLGHGERARRVQSAKRRVVERIVYGVDLKVDAVELARAALWQECATSHLPLPFLNHKIRTGNAIVGTWLLEGAVSSARPVPRWIQPGPTPVEALLEVAANNKAPAHGLLVASKPKLQALVATWQAYHAAPAIVSAWTERAARLLAKVASERRKFLAETRTQRDVETREARFLRQLGDVPEAPSDTRTLLRDKDLEFARAVERLSDYRRLRMIGDFATALYFWPHDRVEAYPSPDVYESVAAKLLGLNREPLRRGAEIAALKTALAVGYERAFFHWEVEFPELFEGGKKPDIVLSNFPWDMTSVGEEDFWKARHPLAGLDGFSPATVAKLVVQNGEAADYRAQVLADRQFSHFLKNAGDFETIQRECDLYRPFNEALRRICGKRAAVLLPQSLWINENAENARRVARDELGWDRIVGFENVGKRFFSSVHASYTFAVCRFSPGTRLAGIETQFRMKTVEERATTAPVTLRWADVERMSADLAIPEVRRERDVEFLLALKKAGRVASEWIPEKGKKRDFDLSTDWKNETLKKVAKPGPRDVSVWRGGHFHIWKPFFQQEDASFEGKGTKTKWAALPEPLPKGLKPYCSLYVDEADARALGGSEAKPYYKEWRIAWRDVARSTDARSMLATLIPPGTVVGHSVYVIRPDDTLDERLVKAAVFGSLVFDAAIRFSAAVHMSIPQVRRIPVPTPAADLREAILTRISKLIGIKSIPSAEDRGTLVNELNALVAVAYTCSTSGAFDESLFQYVLDNHFPSLFTARSDATEESDAAAEESDASEDDQAAAADDDADRGTPDPLDRDAILRYYRRFRAEFGTCCKGDAA